MVLDLETRRAFAEVEGGRPDLLGLSLAVVWSYEREAFTPYFEGDAGALIDRLLGARLVVGFNHVGFDLEVLRPYAEHREIDGVRCFDLLVDLRSRLGHRVSLESCCSATLGSRKAGDGLQAIEWFRQGRLAELEHYCREDVRLTRDLFDHGRSHGQIQVRKRSPSGEWHTATVPVSWPIPDAEAEGSLGGGSPSST
ncbi:ATP-dependent RNA helicase, DEAD/DEAH box family [Vulgatibacter incomptus]|uniref:ATP-dependent RNA helicase, DEAD/DEAH box family n=1 Tax=Vulgatibacter incomptus TaxID=1391653 RepID=A0A0K1PFC9_9BACT|nr:ATP-dependent RNA helicase, DEAD/DEAH box family [Vulgatibacter incomptus]